MTYLCDNVLNFDDFSKKEISKIGCAVPHGCLDGPSLVREDNMEDVHTLTIFRVDGHWVVVHFGDASKDGRDPSNGEG